MKKISVLFAFGVSVCLSAFAQQTPTWEVIDNPEYPTTDEIAVMTYNVKDFGAVGDGVNNDRTAIVNAINKAQADGGGVVYIPEGMYKMGSIITIPSGVTVRGDWKKPVKGQPITGTILMAPNIAPGYDRNRDTQSFIIMESSTSLNNIAIWYPDQKPDNIQPYPPTILLGRQGQWGNDYGNVRNVTLVNSYNGVCLSRNNGGGCPNIYGLYGTALKVGVEIDNIADVGRFDWIDLSPDYWAGSGLPNAPAVNGNHKTYIKENATGIVMRRNDWSYTCYANIEGYNIGFSTLTSPTGVGTAGDPNGHNYKLTFKDCKTAVYCQGISGSGIMFADVTVDNCDNGLVIADGAGSALQTSNWTINAIDNAILISEKASTKVMMQGSTITSGKIDIKGGVFMPTDCDINNTAPQIMIGSAARTIITGNRFANQPIDIKNNSMFLCKIDHAPVDFPATPVFAEHTAKVAKPTKNKLFIVTDYGAKPYIMKNENSATDDNIAIQNAAEDATAAIQQALTDAGDNGGGIVYFPAGHYKVLGTLTVPTGVEIKGTTDFRTVPKGPGSVFEIYSGKDDPAGEPFLKLSQGSGVRGMMFNYPEQTGDLYTAGWHEYPYAIQGAGSDVYVVNVGVRATMHALDLFTNRCDNHYVDYLCGHVFKTGIKVGGGSNGGTISNTQFNTLVYSAGYETKFGHWSNSPDEREPDNAAAEQACYDYNWKYLEFLTLGNCTNQTLYNIFHYGSQRGLIFGDESGDPSGISMGTAIDASRKAVTYRSLGAAGFPMINSQIVSTTGDQNEPTTYLELADGFTGTAQLFNSDYWGGTNSAITANSGNLELYQSHFSASGRLRYALLDQGNIKLQNSDIAANNTLLAPATKAPQVIVESSVINHANTDTTKYASWKNNLSISPVFVASNALLPRTGWIADSFNKNTPQNTSNPQQAIDSTASSRWATIGAQIAGQWFSVNTRAPLLFNKVILDTSGSAGDAPAGYAVYVTNDPSNWGEPVATGPGATVTVINIPTTEAQYVKIGQTTTGVKGNYWSIHEFYLAYVEGEGSSDINNYYTQENKYMYVADGTLYFEGFDEGAAQLNMYSVSGQKAFSVTTSTVSYVDISSLPNGMYIAVVEQNGKVYRSKLIKK